MTAINYFPDEAIEENFLTSLPAAGLEIGLGVGGWAAQGHAGRAFRRSAQNTQAFHRLHKSAFGNSFAPIVGSQRTLRRMAVMDRMNAAKSLYSSRMSMAKNLSKSAFRLGIFSVALFGIEAAGGIWGAAVDWKQKRREMDESRYNIIQNEVPYFDSGAAKTQRQRAIQVIHNSQMTMRAAFGQEANYLHN